MSQFEKIVSRVLLREGGYVNHPADRGGATNFGVTKIFYKEAFEESATDETIRSLTREEAIEAYYRVIWKKYGVNRLPAELQPLMFDWITMSGPRTPILFLQRRIGARADGILGPNTARMARRAIEGRDFRYWQCEFVNDIVRFLIRIARRDHSQIVFLEGWFNRFCGYYLGGDPDEG